MKDILDTFLRALEHRLGFKNKFFVCKTSRINNSKFPAYKVTNVEVWCVDGSYNEKISDVQSTDRITNDEEAKDVEKKLLLNTYENLLSFYGI